MLFARLSIILLVVFISAAPVIVSADSVMKKMETYSYEDIGSSYRVTIDRVRESILVWDYGIKATFCSEKSEYYCVNSDLFSFAVPKHLSKDTHSWAVNGHKYTVVSPLSERNILGTTLEVCIIATSGTTKHGGTGITYYYYSLQRGLLAYSTVVRAAPGDVEVPKGPYPSISISTGAMGFGAEANRP